MEAFLLQQLGAPGKAVRGLDAAPMSERARPSIIIVGGGASGVILAAHLLKAGRTDLRVTLIEKGPAIGRGVAYSTQLSDHLLNVTANRMSAFADDPMHFWNWLERNDLAPGDNPQAFVPRHLYGSYLASLLEEFLQGNEATRRLRLIRDECTSVTPAVSGVDVRLASGVSLAAQVAVLAVGHNSSPAQEQAFATRIGSTADDPPDPDARVMILGTGLSMVDAWLTLCNRGHRGQVLAVSRRGLLPQPHGSPRNPMQLDRADIPLGTELSYFVSWVGRLIVERQKAGGNWRDVVDGLRPYNQLIWQNWPSSAKRRFLNHTKAWWDIHRHRVPPDIHAALSEAVSSGRVKLIAARVLSAEKQDGEIDVRLRPRHSRFTHVERVARVYDCTGIVRDVSAGSITVVRSLVERGLARADPLKLGLDVTTDCAVVAQNGAASDKIFAIGPLTRGTFFEIDAVPDIRLQCARLAKALVS